MTKKKTQPDTQLNLEDTQPKPKAKNQPKQTDPWRDYKLGAAFALLVIGYGILNATRAPDVPRPAPTLEINIEQGTSDTPLPTLTPEQGTAVDTPRTTYYTKNQAFLRECPKRTCATVVQVSAGTALVTDGVVDGDEVSPGNVVWYRVQVGLLTAYVYSEAVTLDANNITVVITMTTAPTSEPTATTAQIIAVPVVATSIPTNTPTDIPIVPTATPLPAFTPETGLAVDMPAKTYYVKSQAIVRECPQRTCASVATLGAGAALVSDGVINGEIVNPGNAIWYRVSYNGQTAYVYSDVVSGAAPAATTSGGATSGGNTQSSSSAAPVPDAAVSCQGFDWAVCQTYNTPANCTEAKSMSIPSHAAACCFPKLDRDKDGDACYND